MTSIEWLISRLSHNNILDHKKLSENKQLYNLYQRLKQQAEEMHREEVVDAWSNGYDEPDRASSNPFKYYDDTFKTKV